MKRAKIIALAILVIAVIAFLLRNTQPIEVDLLFVTPQLPRVLVLIVMLLIGFAGGLITASAAGRRRRNDKFKKEPPA